MYRSAKWIFIILGIFFMFSSVNAYIDFGVDTNWVYLYKYNATSDTYTDVPPATTSLDYFGDSCAINDSFYFRYSTVQHGVRVKLNISTPFSATTVDFKWEYYANVNDWREFDNLNDTCANLSITGECTIEYDMPTRWDNENPIGKGAGTYARLRIDNVTGCSEGGAQGGISIKTGLNTVRVVNEGTEADPITWEDVYQADVAGGWGVVEKISETYYQLKYAGFYTAGSTYMASEDETVEWLAYNYDEDMQFYEYFDSYAIYRMGKLSASGSPANGATLIFNGGYLARVPRGGAGRLLMYASTIRAGGDNLKQTPSAWTIDGYELYMERCNVEYLKFSPGADNVTLKDVYQRGYAQFYLYGQASDIWEVDRMVCRDAGNAPYFSGGYSPNIEIWNSDFRNNSYIVWYYKSVNASFVNHAVPIGGSDCLIRVYQGGVPRAGELFDKYTFDLTVINESFGLVDGANITITDNQGIIYFNITDVNGQIDQQKLIRKHFKGKADGSSGIGVYDTWDHNPHNITIEHEDYQTKSYQVNITTKTEWYNILQGYPFVINGTIVIDQPSNSVVIKKCVC